MFGRSRIFPNGADLRRRKRLDCYNCLDHSRPPANCCTTQHESRGGGRVRDSPGDQRELIRPRIGSAPNGEGRAMAASFIPIRHNAPRLGTWAATFSLLFAAVRVLAASTSAALPARSAYSSAYPSRMPIDLSVPRPATSSITAAASPCLNLGRLPSWSAAGRVSLGV